MNDNLDKTVSLLGPVLFGDALLAARMRQAEATELALFDQRQFDRLSDLMRIDLVRFSHR